jgi:hypothetical protein
VRPLYVLASRPALTFGAPPSEIDAEKLLVIFRKLGAKFTIADRDNLFKQMDTAHRGAASFTEFAVAFSRVDTSKLGGLADFYKCVLRVA